MSLIFFPNVIFMKQVLGPGMFCQLPQGGDAVSAGNHLIYFTLSTSIVSFLSDRSWFSLTENQHRLQPLRRNNHEAVEAWTTDNKLGPWLCPKATSHLVGFVPSVPVASKLPLAYLARRKPAAQAAHLERLHLYSTEDTSLWRNVVASHFLCSVSPASNLGRPCGWCWATVRPELGGS